MNPSTDSLLHLPWIRALITAAGGHEIHLVGGALRDHLLGLPSHDLDVVVSGRGQEIADAFAEQTGAHSISLGGKDFAAYRLVLDDVEIDLWDRAEMSFRDDLARRDLTLNAIALNLDPKCPNDERWVDPFGGRRDIEQKILRATTGGVFEDDPLRVLRLARFAAQFPEFRVDPETLQLARAAAPLLSGVARERVREELDRLLALAEAARGVQVLSQIDLYPHLWLGENNQRKTLADSTARQLSALPEIADHLTECGAPAVDLPDARWAITFTPDPEAPSFLEALDAFHQAGYLTAKRRDRLRILLADDEIPPDPIALRRFVHRQGTTWPTDAARLGARAVIRDEENLWRKRLSNLLKLVASDGANLIQPRTLLDGKAVQDLLTIGPGPEVGQAMRRVRQAQVDGAVRTPEEAKALLREEFGIVP